MPRRRHISRNTLSTPPAHRVRLWAHVQYARTGLRVARAVRLAPASEIKLVSARAADGLYTSTNFANVISAIGRAAKCLSRSRSRCRGTWTIKARAQFGAQAPHEVHNRVWEVRELGHVPSSRRRLASVKSSPPARAFPCPRCWKY